MNRLVHPDGGMPLHGDDFDWQYDGIKEGIRGAIYPFLLKYGGNAILEGCDISFAAGQAIVTEGFVAIGYEICYCPAQTVAVTSLALSSLKIHSTYDPAGLDVFADSVSRDTYERRRAIISDGLNGGDEVNLGAPSRVYKEYDLTPFLQGNWVKDASVSELKAVAFNGQVRLNGAITGGDSNIAALALPSYLIPSQIHFLACPAPNFAESFIQVKVDTDGFVIPFTPGGQLSFNGISLLSLDGVIFSI